MSRSWFIIAAISFCAILASAAEYFSVYEAEREIHLTLTCSPKNVSVSVNGEPLLHWKPEGRWISGKRLGLYMFRSFDMPDEKCRFRNLSVRSPSSPPIRASLLDERDLGTNFEISPGWDIEPGEGMFLEGQPGTRGVSLLKAPETLEFDLNVAILHPVDVGVFFAGSNAENGMVLVVRPFRNDVFLTSLEGGDPGPILKIAPLTTLHTRHEALRLAGFIGRLILQNILFLLLLCWVSRRLASIAGIGISRLSEILNHFLALPYLPHALFWATFLVLACIARYFLEAVPHIADESVYLFQAKIFAAGHLWAPAPEPSDFFAFEHMIMENGRWFGKYPPLFPFLLSLGVRAGVPWLVSPLLGAFCGLTLYHLTDSISGSRKCALLAWLLLLTSPFFLLLNATFMAHGLALLLTLIFVSLALKGLTQDKPSLALLGGLSLGGLIITRPFTAFLVFLPVISYAFLYHLKRRLLTGFLKFAFAMAAGVMPFLLFCAVWQSLYFPGDRHFLNFFYSAYNATDRLGFGPDMGKGWLKTWGSWGHTPAKGLRSVYNYLNYTAGHLLGWPWGLSFAFVGIPLFWGRHKGACLMLFSIFLLLVTGHMFYWATQHLGYGARYWFSGMAGLLVTTALGIKLFRDVAAREPAFDPARKRKVSFILALVLMGLTGWNGACYLPEKLDELHHYGNISADLKNAVLDFPLKQALVFVKTENLLYNDGFFMNDPFLENGLIFARDLGEKNRILMEKYPEYDVYFWDKKGLTQLFRK